MGIKVSKNQRVKLSKIKALALDVDGVLTNCQVFLDASGEWRRFFSVRDGIGIKRLILQGYKVALITGSASQDIRERARVLNISYVYEGHLNKLPPFELFLKETGLKAKEVAYMGDDFFDVPILKQVGFAATVPDAMEEVFPHVDVVANRPGGNGAVRQVCDLLELMGAYAKNKKKENMR